jgi:tetratricopeptide (TPR) repeat protein
MRFLNETALEDYPAAVRDAEAFFKNNPNGNFTSNDYVTYAQALSGTGQDSLAVVQYEIAAKRDPENGDLLKGLSDMYTRAKDYLSAAETYDAYLQLQENPSINDLFGMSGRYLNVAATTTDNDEQRVKAADRGLEYINKVMERAAKQGPLYQRKARLYIARNGNQPDINAIETYKEMTDFLDEDPANMSPENKASLGLYREAYSFGMLYYGNIEKDKDKMAEFTEKYNIVDGILNPKTAEPTAE